MSSKCQVYVLVGSQLIKACQAFKSELNSRTNRRITLPGFSESTASGLLYTMAKISQNTYHVVGLNTYAYSWVLAAAD